jgi:hypothetical protein
LEAKRKRRKRRKGTERNGTDTIIAKISVLESENRNMSQKDKLVKDPDRK